MRWLAALLIIIATGAASADPLEQARELEAQLAYEEALQIVEQAIIGGTSSTDRLVDLHLLGGRLAAGLDRAKIAENHFAVVLALRPATVLPAGTSPKLTAPFDAARARTAPLELRLVTTTEAVAIEPVRDPMGLVTGIAIRFRHRNTDDRKTERGALRIAIDPSWRIDEVAALDAHGNQLWVGTPPPPEPVVIPTPIEPERTPRIRRWTTWAAITGVALAAGAVSAWRFDSAQSQWDRLRDQSNAELTELEQIEERGRRWGLAANISFGVAAATGIATIYFALRGPDEPRPITVTPGPGAGLGLAGRF